MRSFVYWPLHQIKMVDVSFISSINLIQRQTWLTHSSKINQFVAEKSFFFLVSKRIYSVRERIQITETNLRLRTCVHIPFLPRKDSQKTKNQSSFIGSEFHSILFPSLFRVCKDFYHTNVVRVIVILLYNQQPRAISRDICQLALQHCLDSQQKSRDEEVTNERPEKRNMKYFHQ